MSDSVNAFAEMAQGKPHGNISSLPLGTYDLTTNNFEVPALGVEGSLAKYFPVAQAVPLASATERAAKFLTALEDSGNKISLNQTYVAKSEHKPELVAAVEKSDFVLPKVPLALSDVSHDMALKPSDARSEKAASTLSV